METTRRTLERARDLRSHMSLPEVLLWRRLRGAQLGVKFRRQHSVGDYILDFYCCELRLAVEVDGQGHGMGGNAFHDGRRDDRLGALGIRVVRISARTVLKDLDAALATIRGALAERHGPSTEISPLWGEHLPG